MATFQSKLHFLPDCVGLSKSDVSQFSDQVLFCASRTRSLTCLCLFSVFVRVVRTISEVRESSIELKKKDNKIFHFALFFHL